MRDVGHDRPAAAVDDDLVVEDPGDPPVGGRFGGLAAAKELRGADAEVTVVDRISHRGRVR